MISIKGDIYHISKYASLFTINLNNSVSDHIIRRVTIQDEVFYRIY